METTAAAQRRVAGRILIKMKKTIKRRPAEYLLGSRNKKK